jgi:Mycobacterium 19 kDa lipoprotein antigen
VAVDNVALAYQQGSPGASANATQNGDDYKFTGTATGVEIKPTSRRVSSASPSK